SGSPAPPPPSKDTEKASAPAAANGSAHAPERVSSPAPKTAASDIIGLFIMNVSTEEQCRDLFNEEDKDKITKVEKWGNSNKVVQFKTNEDRDAALARLPEDVKTRTQEDRSKPLVKIFQHRETTKTFASRGGAGNWGASGRGGATNTSGYRSAGGASDSESNRRGGRGGRGRGGDRGRGGRGRGGLKGEAGASSPAAAPSTPAID
ncbi:hypothetical protein FGRMN_10454, partial [Fusarium graminum]